MFELSDDSFPFGLEQDSLANSLGAAIPNRSLMIVEGEVGEGKSLIGQRLAYGLVENGTKVAYVTTELTTRGWLEQVDSIGYGMTKAIDEGRFLLMASYGVLTEQVENKVTLFDLLRNDGLKAADFIIIDRASQLLPEGVDPKHLLTEIRRFTSEGRTLMLTMDPHETPEVIFREMKGSAEVVIGLMSMTQGGQLKRTLAVTRFLRAAGPVQARIGWRVEPSMGFIVDITAVS
ncbi:MAG: hypothetical protein CMB13_00605 [Euryarchaeota archaeon]|nr:hypothetical protein [Euryarchaeota archaeon]